MEISIAYQGGGAKLFDLLASVKAAKSVEESERGDFKVFRVSGASAGAVAATIHALGGDIEQIISEAVQLDRILQKNFPEKRTRPLTAGTRLLFNKPLFDEHAVHDTLLELLRHAGIDGERTIADLMAGRNMQLRILCSDILGLTRPIHDERSHTQLIEALVDSCAIPLAFRLPKKGSAKGSIVDGGLFQNLPAEEALRDLRPGQRALGISFFSEARTSMEGYGVLKYIGAIVDSMIAERVQDSARQLGPANVLQLRTEIGTFDFLPLFKGEVRKKFLIKAKSAEEQMKAWFEGSKARSSPDWFSLEKHDMLELEHLTSARALQFYENLAIKSFHADEAKHEVFAQSILGDEHPDIYTTTLRFSGEKNPGLQFLRFRFYAPDRQQLLQPEVRVEDERGNPVAALVLPMREPGGERSRSVLICLAEPLESGQSVTIRKTETAHGAMRRYLTDGWTEETFAIGPGKSADAMTVAAHFPRARLPRDRHDADRNIELERRELDREEGLHLLTIASTQPDIARGVTSYLNTTCEAHLPSDRVRFIKVFYYK